MVSVVEKINEPRYPSFKGIMAAKKKPVETLTLATSAWTRPRSASAASWSAVDRLRSTSAPREQGTVVTDEGDGGVKLADFLSAQKFI